MAALPNIKLTEEEYLAFERASDVRHEYYYGSVVAMAGASQHHNLITLNTAASLHVQVRKRDCRVYQSDMRLKVPVMKLYTYPDVMVVCGEAKFSQEKGDTQDTLLNPNVIIEVLSPSTGDYDRGAKFTYYQTLESLQEYVLIAQDTPRIEWYTRQSDHQWLLTIETNSSASVEFKSVQCTLALADVYEKVTFAEDSQDVED